MQFFPGRATVSTILRALAGVVDYEGSSVGVCEYGADAGFFLCCGELAVVGGGYCGAAE